MKIPKIIWSFWGSRKYPETVKRCIESWRWYNPGYKINVITPRTIRRFFHEKNILKLRHAKESLARLSDFVRLNVLYKHGGIWIDASTLCTEPFDDWYKRIGVKSGTEFVGYYNSMFTSRRRYPVIESWFFACAKRSPFVRRWRDEFMRINDFEEVDDYLDEVEKIISFQNIPKYDDPNYLAIHVAAQVVLQWERYPTRNMIILRAESGPLKYLLSDPDLTDTQKVRRICKENKMWSRPIIKFIGSTRAVLERNKSLRRCVFDKWMEKSRD